MDDFISKCFNYLSSTADRRSPEIFRRWAAIALCAGALERRVWVRTGEMTTFCNLYTLLVAPPGTGKSIIETVRELWAAAVVPKSVAPAFNVAPDSMTHASLVDDLSTATRTRLLPTGKSYVSASMLVAAEEFSVLMPAYDMLYIGKLNRIYGNPPLHKETRRFGVKEVNITNPQLNILGGVQPVFLSNVFPDEVWQTGLARRIMMIYSAERKPTDPFAIYEGLPTQRQEILDALGLLSDAYGPVGWSDGAAKIFREWVLAGEPPVPEHSKLVGYKTNRAQNVIKLAGISAVSRDIEAKTFTIEAVDCKRAMEWLFEAERYMPDVFRAMLGRSDHAVLEELYIYVMSVFERNGRQAFAGKYIYQFLSERAPADKINNLVGLAIRNQMIDCTDQVNDLWIPKPKYFQATE